MKNLAFIIHGKINKPATIAAQIKDVFGNDCNILFTEYAGHASTLVSTALEKGAGTVICVGGDGSLNEVANGVMAAKNNGLITQSQAERLRVGILPKGTGNDFARTVKVPYDLPLLKNLIEKDSYKQIDLGLVNCLSPEGKETARYFINISDCGIGGAISKKLESSSKFLGPALTYQMSIITTFFQYRNKYIKVQADSFNFEGKVLNFIVANGKYFGGGMGIAPDAQADDGKFSVVIIGEISLWDYFKNLGNIKRCVRINHPGIQYLSVQKINVTGLNEPVLAEMDGEFIGSTPIQFQLIAKALNFLAPL